MNRFSIGERHEPARQAAAAVAAARVHDAGEQRERQHGCGREQDRQRRRARPAGDDGAPLASQSGRARERGSPGRSPMPSSNSSEGIDRRGDARPVVAHGFVDEADRVELGNESVVGLELAGDAEMGVPEGRGAGEHRARTASAAHPGASTRPTSGRAPAGQRARGTRAPTRRWPYTAAPLSPGIADKPGASDRNTKRTLSSFLIVRKRPGHGATRRQSITRGRGLPLSLTARGADHHRLRCLPHHRDRAAFTPGGTACSSRASAGTAVAPRCGRCMGERLRAAVQRRMEMSARVPVASSANCSDGLLFCR